MQLSQYQKYKIIFMHEQNNSILSIAEELGINRHTVSKWIVRYSNSNFKRLKGSGRPKKCTNEIWLTISKEITDNKYITLGEIPNNIKNTIKLSISTIKTILNDNNYNYDYPIGRFPLSEEHKTTRLKYAIKYLNFDWTEVIFSDEVAFWMSNKPSKRWHNKNIQDDHDILFKHSYKINAWGAISINKTFELNIFTTIMDAEKYINILETNFLPKYTNNLYFQFDNDPKHKSVKAKNFIIKHKIKTIDHPPCSPDLNPIENIWGILKHKLSKYKFETIEQFKQSVLDEWKKIDKNTINNTILSMKNRLQVVIDNRGGYTDY